MRRKRITNWRDALWEENEVLSHITSKTLNITKRLSPNLKFEHVFCLTLTAEDQEFSPEKPISWTRFEPEPPKYIGD